MSTWKIRTQRLDQSALADELTSWLSERSEGVYLFREGPTLSEFHWGNAHDISEAELSRIWLVRFFCVEFEVYARRFGYEDGQSWQVRFAATPKHLADGKELTMLDKQTLLLLGEATGDGDAFEQKPFRYRRAPLRYPGTEWSPGQWCGLVTRRFQPSEGRAIVCWQKLAALQSETQSAQATE